MLDDVEYVQLQSTEVFGASLKVLGSHVHDHGMRDVSECFAMCGASSDCNGFVHYSKSSICSFKRGGKVREGFPGSSVYVRKKPPQSQMSPTVPPPSPPPLPPSIPLSVMGGVRLVPNFVTAKEAKRLVRFADGCFKRGAAPVNAKDEVSVGHPSCVANSTSVLLSRIEERIARLTGIPVHEGEEALMFTRMAPVGVAGPWFANVHHDKNKNEQREATVIVYLTSQGDGMGGHTLFPTLEAVSAPEPPGSVSTGSIVQGVAGRDAWPSQTAHAQAASEAFARGERALGCADGSSCGEAGGLVAHTEAECAAALRGEARVLAIRPQRGMALVFLSDNDQMWHAACLARAVGRSGRWVLQKFKAPPPQPERERPMATEGGEQADTCVATSAMPAQPHAQG
jgi:hypothetical protein